MDLRNNQITVGEIMKNPQAAALFKREFPEWAGSPLIRMASGMPLSKVLKIAKKHIAEEKITTFINKLEQV